jgi:hypothetical protein
MADADSVKAATELAAAKLKSLELLFDYTKFHIGLYLTLAGSYITIATVRVGDALVVPLKPFWMWIAMGGFMLAGLAGGIIASSITQWVGSPTTPCESAALFLDQYTGPWGWEWLHVFKVRTWTYIEHTSFWVGLFAALLSFVGARKAC